MVYSAGNRRGLGHLFPVRSLHMKYVAETIWSEPDKDGKFRIKSDIAVRDDIDECHAWLNGYEGWIKRNDFRLKSQKIFEIEEVRA